MIAALIRTLPPGVVLCIVLGAMGGLGQAIFDALRWWEARP